MHPDRRSGEEGSEVAWQLLVDESTYAARMRGDATFAARLEERRALWRTFARAHGFAACPADLAALATRAPSPAELDAVRMALSPAGA